MEPSSSLTDDAEFSLPPEFLTDDDFTVEKENNVFEGYDEYKPSHGTDSSVKPIGDEEKLFAGFTRKTDQSSLQDDFSGNDAKAWSATRCGAGIGFRCRNHNCQTRGSSQASELDLYCAAAEDLAMMNINGYNNHSSRGLVDLYCAAAKIPNDGSGYYSHQSLQYQKLQAIQFQQLKQQQLMKHHRQLVQLSRGLGPSYAWSNQPLRRGSIGTGVFFPRLVSHATAKTRQKKPMVATGLVPARVVQPSVRSSSLSLNDASWRQMKMEEQSVNEPRLPSEWAY